MNERMMRASPSSCAGFLGGFLDAPEQGQKVGPAGGQNGLNTEETASNCEDASQLRIQTQAVCVVLSLLVLRGVLSTSESRKSGVSRRGACKMQAFCSCLVGSYC
jgi:hypothetical protein